MIDSLPKHIQKYLNKYAFRFWKTYGIAEKYKSIIVIPAISESDNIKKLLLSLHCNYQSYFKSTLILFVINSTNSSNIEVKEDNLNTLQFLRKIIDQVDAEDELIANIQKSNLQIALIDASSESMEFNDKDGGVGLARKIGMDEALKYFDYSTSQKNILICLDADCTVSKNYISTIRNSFDKDNLQAAYVNFSHVTPDDEENYKAIINYEIFLRYYVLGLRFAGSPFAYHSIGSTMVCDVESYVKIQGMNKRKAAEDFYFMEKLSKIVEIRKIDGAMVYPSSRGSWRVPFGTGKRVSRFLEKVQNEYLLYSPKSFVVLKQWVELFHSQNALKSIEYLQKSQNISTPLFDFLIINKFEQTWDKVILNTQSSDQLTKQKKLWFDGFKTLKLIHHLRDTNFPMENMFDVLDEMFMIMQIEFNYTNVPGSIPSLEIQEMYLQKLREIA